MHTAEVCVPGLVCGGLSADAADCVVNVKATTLRMAFNEMANHLVVYNNNNNNLRLYTS